MNKGVLRFAIIVLLFVCCVFVLDYFVGMFFDNKMQQMPNEGERVAKSQYVLNKVEADIVIVGSSRAECHYDSHILIDSLKNYTVYNGGGDGQGFYYCNTVVNCLIRRYAPKVIIWDFKVYELIDDEIENLSLLYPYYESNEYIKETLLRHEGSALKYKMLLNAYRYNGTGARILRSIYTPKDNLQNHYGYGPRPVNPNSKDIIPHDNNSHFNVPVDVNKIELLQKTIDLAKAKNTQIIIIVSPMYNHYDDNNDSMSKTRQICLDNDIPFIDDGQLPEFIHNNEYAVDNNHLNYIGAEYFTKILIEQIKSYIPDAF